MYYGVRNSFKIKTRILNIVLQYAQNVSGFEQTPTSSQFIEALADIEVKSSSQIEEKECSICLKVPEVGDILHQLPCKHSFHKSCIIQWLKKVRRERGSADMSRILITFESQLVTIKSHLTFERLNQSF